MSLLLLDSFDIFAHKVCADFDSCSVVNVAKEYIVAFIIWTC